MKRTDKSHQVVTYHLNRKEHELALVRYIQDHNTEDGTIGFVPPAVGGNVLSIDYSLDGDGGASVAIVYAGEPKAPKMIELGYCPKCKAQYEVVGHTLAFSSDEPGTLLCHSCKHAAPWPAKAT